MEETQREEKQSLEESSYEWRLQELERAYKTAYAKGYDDGYDTGYGEGCSDGRGKGYDAGYADGRADCSGGNPAWVVRQKS